MWYDTYNLSLHKRVSAEARLSIKCFTDHAIATFHHETRPRTHKSQKKQFDELFGFVVDDLVALNKWNRYASLIGQECIVVADDSIIADFPDEAKHVGNLVYARSIVDEMSIYEIDGLHITPLVECMFLSGDNVAKLWNFFANMLQPVNR